MKSSHSEPKFQTFKKAVFYKDLRYDCIAQLGLAGGR